MQVVKRRHELDIFIDILKAAKKGALKSHIAGITHLNYKQTIDYLDSLNHKKLIVIKKSDSTSEIVQTTKRGLNLIEKYTDLITLIRYSHRFLEEVS